MSYASLEKTSGGSWLGSPERIIPVKDDPRAIIGIVIFSGFAHSHSLMMEKGLVFQESTHSRAYRHRKHTSLNCYLSGSIISLLLILLPLFGI